MICFTYTNKLGEIPLSLMFHVEGGCLWRKIWRKSCQYSVEYLLSVALGSGYILNKDTGMCMQRPETKPNLKGRSACAAS